MIKVFSGFFLIITCGSLISNVTSHSSKCLLDILAGFLVDGPKTTLRRFATGKITSEPSSEPPGVPSDTSLIRRPDALGTWPLIAREGSLISFSLALSSESVAGGVGRVLGVAAGAMAPELLELGRARPPEHPATGSIMLAAVEGVAMSTSVERLL
jgi:hypothetical protein